MEKEFIPYEQALALKELGFDEPCLAYYRKNNTELYFGEGFELVTREYRRNVMYYPLKNSRYIAGSNAPDGYYYLTTSPTFSQAFRWFREKYGLIPNIHSIYEDETYTKIKFWFWFGNYEDDSDDEVFYKTYEEAELECLKKLIEIVKNK